RRQLVAAQRVGRDGELHDRLGVRVRLDDGGRIGAVRQAVGDAAQRIADVGGGVVEIDPVVEGEGDARAAVAAVRGDRGDALDPGDDALDGRGDLAVDGL